MRRPHGVEVVTEEVFLARTALVLLGLIGKGKERDRRPTQDELDRLLKYLDRNNRPTMPVGRMVQFAIATAMRQEEICSITWKDIDVRKRIVVVRDRKDPRQKVGNDQKVPLIGATGVDAWQIWQRQKFASPNTERVVPYNGRSVGTAFRRACRDLMNPARIRRAPAAFAPIWRRHRQLHHDLSIFTTPGDFMNCPLQTGRWYIY